METSRESLLQKVNHLILDFRLGIIENRLKEIQLQLRQVGNDMDRIRQLLEEQKEIQQLRNAMAKQLGADIIVRK